MPLLGDPACCPGTAVPSQKQEVKAASIKSQWHHADWISMLRNNIILFFCLWRQHFIQFCKDYTLKRNISFICLLSYIVCSGISALDINWDAIYLIRSELNTFIITLICFSGLSLQVEMTYIRKFIDKCVTTCHTAYTDEKPVLGGVYDKHIVFLIHVTDKLNSEMFENGTLSQGRDCPDFSFNTKLSMDYLSGYLSMWIFSLADFAVI